MHKLNECKVEERQVMNAGARILLSFYEFPSVFAAVVFWRNIRGTERYKSVFHRHR